jgi:hypothetical protein
MNLSIWEIGISFVKFTSSPMCQVEVWGVLFASVKVGVICTSGQLSSLWIWQSCKNVTAKGIMRYMCLFLSVWCVMGKEVLNVGFSGSLWIRKMELGQLNSRERDRTIWPLETFSHSICYAASKNFSRFSLTVFRYFWKDCHRQVNLYNFFVMNWSTGHIVYAFVFRYNWSNLVLLDYCFLT